MIAVLGITSILLFTMGIIGFLIRRNPLIMFMSIELMLNAVTLGIMLFGRIYQDVNAHVLTIFIIIIAAAEVAVGLGILVTLFTDRDDVDVDKINLMKG